MPSNPRGPEDSSKPGKAYDSMLRKLTSVKNPCSYSKCYHFTYLNYRAAGINDKRQKLPFHIIIAGYCFYQRFAIILPI